MIREIKGAFLMRKGRLERAGQKMPSSWKDFLCRVFPPGAKDRKKAGSGSGFGFNWYLAGYNPADQSPTFPRGYRNAFGNQSNPSRWGIK